MPRLPKLTLRGVQRSMGDSPNGLGSLERQVMAVLWKESGRGELEMRRMTVREVHRELQNHRERSAYTTIMTTLDRLFKKHLLSRIADGRAYRYQARLSRGEFEGTLAAHVIHGLLKEAPDAGRAAPVLACIVDAVSAGDRSLLDELERLIQEKRAALQPEDQRAMSPQVAGQPTGARRGSALSPPGPAGEDT